MVASYEELNVSAAPCWRCEACSGRLLAKKADGTITESEAASLADDAERECEDAGISPVRPRR